MDVTNNLNEQQAAALLAEDAELHVLVDVAASLRDEGQPAAWFSTLRRRKPADYRPR